MSAPEITAIKLAIDVLYIFREANIASGGTIRRALVDHSNWALGAVSLADQLLMSSDSIELILDLWVDYPLVKPAERVTESIEPTGIAALGKGLTISQLESALATLDLQQISNLQVSLAMQLDAVGKMGDERMDELYEAVQSTWMLVTRVMLQNMADGCYQ